MVNAQGENFIELLSRLMEEKHVSISGSAKANRKRFRRELRLSGRIVVTGNQIIRLKQESGRIKQ